MRFVVPVVLLLLAAIHILPLAGVLGADKLTSLYAIDAREPNLDILLRHRAVLFGLLAALLVCAAFKPGLHRLALIAATVSVLSFVVIAQWVGGYNAALSTVVRVDLIALGLLCVGAGAHLLQPPS
jgi:hypothetical protein